MITETETCRWLLTPKPNPLASVDVFCFPYAGASPQIFRRWADYLPLSCELHVVQLPGRGGRRLETSYTHSDRLVAALTKVLVPVMNRPFIFFGHSMGALVGFELARTLRRGYGIQPRHLFVSGRRAPQIPDDTNSIHNLTDDQLINELRRLNGTPEELLREPDLVRLVLPALRADFEV